MKDYKPDYEEMMKDGLKQIEIGKRMVDYAKYCLEEDMDETEEEASEEDDSEEEEDDEEESRPKGMGKSGIILAIKKGAFK